MKHCLYSNYSGFELLSYLFELSGVLFHYIRLLVVLFVTAMVSYV